MSAAGASGRPKLEGTSTNLRVLREQCRLSIMASLDAVVAAEGSGIRLVLDAALTGPLGLIAEVSEFRAHGVEKTFHLESGPPPPGTGPLVYFIRAELRSGRAVAVQLASTSADAPCGARPGQPSAQRATLYFVPRRSLLCEKLLEEAGVYSRVSVRECPLHLFPLDDDILSLERPCFRALYLDGDHSVLHSVAASILQLEQLYGPIPAIRGKGACAQQVARIVQQMRQSEPARARPPARQDTQTDGARRCRRIGRMLLLDRVCDMVTPLLTELTYEGLIHSVFRIRHGSVNLDPAVLGLSSARPLKRELNSNDALYAHIRNRNFGDVGPLLRKLSHDVSEGYEERHTAHTVYQIRDFMRKLSKLQSTHKSLSMHVHLAQRIQQHTSAAEFHARISAEQQALANAGATAEGEAALEDEIGRGAPMHSVLRLACLFSVLGNGVKEKKLAALHSELIAQYGYAGVALTLNALHKVGLLRRGDARSGWQALCKALDLVADDVPEVQGFEQPSDMSYFYSGYCPLSARIVGWMTATTPHWSAREEALRPLPGPLFWADAPLARDGDATAGRNSFASSVRESDVDADASEYPGTTLVYFIGGCTFAELSALRWLGSQFRPPREFLVATTHMTSGDEIIQSLSETFENHLCSLDDDTHPPPRQ